MVLYDNWEDYVSTVIFCFCLILILYNVYIFFQQRVYKVYSTGSIVIFTILLLVARCSTLAYLTITD